MQKEGKCELLTNLFKQRDTKCFGNVESVESKEESENHMSDNQIFRQIPAIEQMLSIIKKDFRFSELNHEATVALLRHATDKIRQELANGLIKDEGEAVAGKLSHRIIELAAQESELLLEPRLRKVVNGTGVVLHTNLGRAPLSERARSEVLSVMKGYSSLEYDLEAGGRGERYSHVSTRLQELTGAEEAIVVNNNAAAVLLVLSGVARGREVLVSRGELVEIGGSFRIPDVIRQSGAILVEVGTTNKTHLEDFSAAITPNTAAILKVHTSNFEIIGFTSQPSFGELCGLAREKGLISINDVGSGTLLPLTLAEHREPTVPECISAGFDLVTFSGDKLLGAGQAGIIVGKKQYIDKLKQEPLLRAIRIDKLSLAALEGTLIDYLTGQPELLIPSWIMLNMNEVDLEKKAVTLARQLAPIEAAGWGVKVVPTRSLSGGGSLPGVELNGFGVEILPGDMSAAKMERLLRANKIPIVGLLRGNALIIDARCLLPGDDQIICAALAGIVEETFA